MVVVLVAAGIAVVVLTSGDDDALTTVAEPSDAPSPTAEPTTGPTGPTGPTAEESPTAEAPTEEPEGIALSVRGVDIRIASAATRGRYVSGEETFFPTETGDVFLIVRGTFEGQGDRIHDFDVSVVDENGRRDGPSFIVTDVVVSQGTGEGDVEWAFVVSGSSGSFTMSLPEGVVVDLGALLG